MMTADPAALAVIFGMALATYLCRVGGVWLMAHVPLTHRVRRGLAALPGSIIAATIVPLALKGGPPALLALATAVLIMVVKRNELLALIGGLVVASVARAFGL